MVLPKDNVQWSEECDERGIGGKPHVNVNLDDNLFTTLTLTLTTT